MEIINAEYFISNLKMNVHPEGGYFSEIYRSSVCTYIENLEGTRRNLATSIFFLLKSNQVSKFHQLKSDEIWYYHFGSSLSIYKIDEKGVLTIEVLGPDIEKGEKLQVILTAGTIFGAAVIEKESFCIVGCMVNPGFDFRDFRLVSKSELKTLIPQQESIIDLLS